MPYTQDANEWLNQVDPWGDGEALDLLHAAQTGRTIGIYDCASTSDGTRWFVMAPHAENVLLLPTADAWRAFIAEVVERYDLGRPVLAAARFAWEPVRDLAAGASHDANGRAANESRPMPLMDLVIPKHAKR
jgi:hypothetical protein